MCFGVCIVLVWQCSTAAAMPYATGLYLEEGDNIEAGAGAASDAVITINYEELS